MVKKIIPFKDGSGILGCWKYDPEFKEWSFIPEYKNSISEEHMKYVLLELKKIKREQ